MVTLVAFLSLFIGAVSAQSSIPTYANCDKFAISKSDWTSAQCAQECKNREVETGPVSGLFVAKCILSEYVVSADAPPMVQSVDGVCLTNWIYGKKPTAAQLLGITATPAACQDMCNMRNSIECLTFYWQPNDQTEGNCYATTEEEVIWASSPFIWTHPNRTVYCEKANCISSEYDCISCGGEEVCAFSESFPTAITGARKCTGFDLCAYTGDLTTTEEPASAAPLSIAAGLMFLITV